MDELVNTATPESGVAAQGANQPTNDIAGAAPGETKAETMKRMYNVTVDGESFDVDEDELRRGYAHNKAAAKRMEEAAMSKKEATQVLRLFQENPREAFKLLGKDAREFATAIINDELSEAMLSPQEKELRDYKSKVDKFETEQRLAKEEYDQEQMNAAINQQAETIQADIIQNLQASGLPKTERTVSRIVYYMQAALQAGYNVTPADVMGQVKADYKQDLNSMLGGLPEDALEAFLGADVVRKIAKSTVKQSPMERAVPKSVNQNRPKPVDSGKKFVSPREYFRK